MRIKNSKVFVLIGVSGVGKSKILQEALLKLPFLCFIPSDTTRPQQEGEVRGVNYNFLTLSEFTDRQLNNAYIESNLYTGHWYGTPKDRYLMSLVSGSCPIKDIEPLGAEELRGVFGDQLVSIYIDAPIEIIESRRQSRNSNRDSQRKEEDYELFATAKNNCDYVIDNTTLEISVEALCNIILAEVM